MPTSEPFKKEKPHEDSRYIFPVPKENLFQS